MREQSAHTKAEKKAPELYNALKKN